MMNDESKIAGWDAMRKDRKKPPLVGEVM